jgi:hypothetical protein
MLTNNNDSTNTNTKQVNSATEAAVTVPGGYRLPENNTMQHAAKLAIVEDKPIVMDYWTNSLDKTVLIGVKENQEKLLVKNEEEYTSPIAKIFKVGKEFIVITENSIYIVDVEIPKKMISS